MDRTEIHMEHASEIAFGLIDTVQSLDLMEEFMDSVLGADDRDYDDRLVALLGELTFRLREKPERFIGAVDRLIDFFEDMETDQETIEILCVLNCIRQKAEFYAAEEGRSVETITIDGGAALRRYRERVEVAINDKKVTVPLVSEVSWLSISKPFPVPFCSHSVPSLSIVVSGDRIKLSHPYR